MLNCVKFLGKMSAFQSLQWIFGIVYYFVSSPVVGMIFEFLVAYEGNFIAIFFLVAKWKDIKQKYLNWKEKANKSGHSGVSDSQSSPQYCGYLLLGLFWSEMMCWADRADGAGRTWLSLSWRHKATD